MNENERIVCEFLRKIAPSREWRYLGEVEHYWIGELCDELNKQLKAENAKLREQVDAAHMSRLLTENENESLRELCGFMLRCMKRNHDCDCCLVNGEHCEISYIESDARELGVEVDA